MRFESAEYSVAKASSPLEYIQKKRKNERKERENEEKKKRPHPHNATLFHKEHKIKTHYREASSRNNSL